jgi:phage replication-related protein YjqB (UPF0714/DUF867 family)
MQNCCSKNSAEIGVQLSFPKKLQKLVVDDFPISDNHSVKNFLVAMIPKVTNKFLQSFSSMQKVSAYI